MVEKYRVEKILVFIFEKGKLVYELFLIEVIRKYKEINFNKFWKEVICLKFLYEYYVDLL